MYDAVYLLQLIVLTASQGSPNGNSRRTILCNVEFIRAYDDLHFQVEKFLKWVSEPMDEEASQESVSQDNAQDTCTSSDSEEQEMSVKKGDGPLETSSQEPEKCQAISSAGELGTEENAGDGTVTAATDKEGRVTQITPDSLQVDTEGKTKYASPCIFR